MKIVKPMMLILLMLGNVAVQAKTFTINQHHFEIKTTQSENEEGFEQDNIELYRGAKKLLTHTQRLSTGDCSILTIELGDFEVKNDQLIFYTYWAVGDRQGLWTFPYGVRKQVYSVDPKGMVKLISAEIYVEDVMGDPFTNHPQEDYLQFLNTPPKNTQQKKALNDYIQSMQSRYKARFVHGQARALLIKEVKAKLAKQIANETKGWKEDFGQNVRM